MRASNELSSQQCAARAVRALAAGLALAMGAGALAQPGPGTPPDSGSPADDRGPRPAEAEALTARIHVLGASLSAGAGNSVELDTPKDVRLGRFLAAALPPESARIEDHGDMWFFTQPVKRGAEQVEAALAGHPTLVVALDFLFWYGYGDAFRNDDERVARLERGLAQLDRFACPIVIGDLPDITIALKGRGPLGTPLVTRGMIPPKDVLERLNARIAAWMAERPRVAQVPLAPMLARFQAGEKLTLRGNSWHPEAISEVLQADLLHPTARGTTWVALATWDVLARTHESIAELPLVLDERKLLERLMAATADERAKEAKKRADREERRRRAEERQRQREGAGVGGGDDGAAAPPPPAARRAA